jgi:hypothetical protein
MRKGAISRDGVLKAIAEYDELGRDMFLSEYGYKPATGYLLIHEDKGRPPKLPRQIKRLALTAGPLFPEPK